MKSRISRIILLSLFALAISACSQQDNTNAPKENTTKTIIIGLDDNFPPMGFRDEQNNLVGFDIDLAKAAAEHLGMQIELKPIDWSSKEIELNTKRVDALWNGVTITEDRKKNVAFSIPYMENHQIIIVNATSTIQNKNDLANTNVGVQEGSSAINAIQKEPNVLNSFKALKTYTDNVSALMDLSSGRIDAVVMDEVVGRYYLKKKPDTYRILEDNFGTEQYGVALRKEDTELLEKLNQALKDLKENGNSAKISQKWFNKDIIL